MHFQTFLQVKNYRRYTKYLLITLQFILTPGLIGSNIYFITRKSSVHSFNHLNSQKATNSNELKKLFHLAEIDNLNLPANNSKLQEMELDKLFFEHSPQLPRPDCRSIINGDEEVIAQTNLLQLSLNSRKYKNFRNLTKILNRNLTTMTENCTEFLSKRKYVRVPLSAEEEFYPIAYIITMHNQFSTLERLLRSIYHPQNIYCIHVDKKADKEVITSVRMLSRCFNNVFIPSTLVKVYYSHWSRVQADIECMQELVKRADIVQWKYVINLCGQDFPLKTNLDIVRALKSLLGYNNLETIVMPPHKKKRYEFKYVLPRSKDFDHSTMERTNERKSASPLNSPMFAGSAYFIFKREAVEFILTNPTVQDFFIWNQDSYSPDEHMWATLQRWYPNVPGSFPPHIKYDLNELQSIARLVKWAGLDSSVYPKCSGRFLRSVCVYGAGDLSWLLQQHHLFANKFDFNLRTFVVECLDIYLRKKAIKQTVIHHSGGVV